MASWQYAWLTDQPYTTIGFSHPQPGLAAELAGVLGVGVFMQQSNEWAISLDRSRVNLGYVAGLLGDRGWEMFSVETRLQPGAMTPNQLQTNWYYKKPGPDRPAATMATSAGAGASAMSSGTPAAQTATPAASQWGSAASAPAASAATPAAMAPQAAPQAAVPAAPVAPQPPAAPPGPDQAPMTAASTPPPGPEGPGMPQT